MISRSQGGLGSGQDVSTGSSSRSESGRRGRRAPGQDDPTEAAQAFVARSALTWWASPAGLDATDTGRWRAARCSDTARGADAGAVRRTGQARWTMAGRIDAGGRRSAPSPTRRRGPAPRAARPLSRRSTAWPRPPRDVGVGVVHPRALTLGVGGMGGCGLVAVASFSAPSCQSLQPSRDCAPVMTGTLALGAPRRWPWPPGGC